MIEGNNIKKRLNKLNASLKDVEQKILNFANFYFPEAQKVAMQAGAELQKVEFFYEYSTGRETIATFVEDLEAIYKTHRVNKLQDVKNGCNHSELKEFLSFLAEEEGGYLFRKLLCNPSEPIDKWLSSISGISVIWAEVKIQFVYFQKGGNWRTANQLFENFYNMLLRSRTGEKVIREWAKRLVLDDSKDRPCQYFLALYGGLYNSSSQNPRDCINEFIEFFEDKTFGSYDSERFLYKERIIQFLEEQEALDAIQNFDIYIYYVLDFPIKLNLNIDL